jgi:hypothetical protein
MAAQRIDHQRRWRSGVAAVIIIIIILGVLNLFSLTVIYVTVLCVKIYSRVSGKSNGCRTVNKKLKRK